MEREDMAGEDMDREDMDHSVPAPDPGAEDHSGHVMPPDTVR